MMAASHLPIGLPHFVIETPRRASACASAKRQTVTLAMYVALAMGLPSSEFTSVRDTEYISAKGAHCWLSCFAEETSVASLTIYSVPSNIGANGRGEIHEYS